MQGLLRLSRGIDWLNEMIGKAVFWLVLAAVLVSAINAVIRYGLNISSNAWLELQWYFFGAIFLLCAGYTLLRNEHIRGLLGLILLAASVKRSAAARTSDTATSASGLTGGASDMKPVSV